MTLCVNPAPHGAMQTDKFVPLYFYPKSPENGFIRSFSIYLTQFGVYEKGNAM